ncbi:peroxisomal NADH pyrophosphatase NUDT12 [Nannizzia gypsea CBS 118893]|uniref:NAD(+) diphosphatase n=1 Tax=Arthroderma gypseum (strain ATCC MYA-4604 / CBS 118893) TaxID=535722 RepID=E4URS2_ARTGP|nr:peroxisomal NADH pyrophosphatase NUDT12 [Nannizzia gypsea CBS 118893]EFR01194.1 peroxisomal NADH pyrophosphatase NUDT12 [Nannizzia gypsea CBS 118893]
MSRDAMPNPAHVDADTLLSRKFGKETVNYFASSPLNRVSFLRSDNLFISNALKHPSAKFLLFNQLAPLSRNPKELYYASYQEVESIIPLDLFDKPEKEIIENYNSGKMVPLVIFLGLHESQPEDGGFMYRSYKGTPYFALDVTPHGPLGEVAKKIIETMESKSLTFNKARAITSLPSDDAAIYAQARHTIDWNARNAFCGACGQRTISTNAGSKRACPPTDLGLSTDQSRPPCHTRNTISNLSFPRTDPTVIAAVVSHDGKKVLLGRQKRYPPHWYSTLAGFIEPGESVEDAVRREVWEESGVIVSRVIIHSTQPWPYPANLMIGAIGQTAKPEDETVCLSHDPELEEAKWFDIADVQEALKTGVSSLGAPPPPGYKEGGLRLAPSTAIAYFLIEAAANTELLGNQYVPRI